METKSKYKYLCETEFCGLMVAAVSSDKYPPTLIQIGANDGKTEYAKPDGKDFVFDFLMDNAQWDGVLVEPLPCIFPVLKKNYREHENNLTFLNSAITENNEIVKMFIDGRDGKRSTLLVDDLNIESRSNLVDVQGIRYDFMCNLLGLKHVTFLKIDAEGYDEVIVNQVISGNSKYLPDYILWENTSNTISDLEKRLLTLGFDLYVTGISKGGRYMDKIAVWRVCN